MGQAHLTTELHKLMTEHKLNVSNTEGWNTQSSRSKFELDSINLLMDRSYKFILYVKLYNTVFTLYLEFQNDLDTCFNVD